MITDGKSILRGQRRLVHKRSLRQDGQSLQPDAPDDARHVGASPLSIERLTAKHPAIEDRANKQFRDVA